MPLHGRVQENFKRNSNMSILGISLTTIWAIGSLIDFILVLFIVRFTEKRNPIQWVDYILFTIFTFSSWIGLIYLYLLYRDTDPEDTLK